MANRYWVGGSGTWNTTSTTNWSATSGGASGASVPTAADSVFFDQAGTYTVTCTGALTCLDITVSAGTVTFAAGTAPTFAISGSMSLIAVTVWNATGAVTFNATTTGKTVTTNGATISSNQITFSGSGGGWTLGSALTNSIGSIVVSQGTFDTGGYNATATQFSSGGAITRSVSFGSSTITATLGVSNAFNFTSTGITFNAGTSTLVGSSATSGIAGAGLTFYNASFTSTTAGTKTITGANTFNNFAVTAPSTAGVTQVTFDSPQTINGTLSTTGTAGNRRVWFRGVTYGLAQTLTINSAPSLTDADFRDIYVIGTAAPISGTRIGNLAGCSGITFDAPKTVYWATAAGGNWSGTNWATSAGGAVSDANFPLAQDTATFVNTGLNTSATVTWDQLINYTGTIDMSGRATAMTFTPASGGFTIYGDYKNGSGTTVSAAGTFNFSGRNTQTITSAGKAFSGTIFTIDSYGGTVQLADALNVGSTFLTITNGTFDTQGYSVTAGQLSSSNSNVRTINLGASTVTLSSASPIAFTTSTNLTFNAGTSTIVSSLNTSGTGTFNGGGQTFYNYSVTNSATATLTLTIAGQNTFNNLTFATTSATAIIQVFAFSSNQTINGTLTCAGASAVRRIFLRSDTLGTQRDLTVGTLSANDCDFRDIEILGAAIGTAPTRAGDCGGNSGITFPAPKTVYWNLAGAQNWSATGWASSSGGSPAVNNFPLAQDTAVFDNTGSVTGNISFDAAWNVGTFDASGRTSAMTLTTAGNSPSVYGDWKFGTGVSSVSTTGAITFQKRGTQTITSNGVTFGCALTIDSVTGTVQLADALTLNSARTLTLTSGTFDAVTYNVTVGLFNNTSATTATVLKMGSGTWTLSGTGTVWNTNTLTFYKGTANIVLSDTSTTARTFSAGTFSYNKLTIGGTTGISTLTINGNGAQFTELASTKTVAHTIALGTATLTFGAWTVSGTVGNVVTVTGTGTITIAGARVSGVNYLALGTTVISATSPGEFYAGANSTGGTNAILTAAPAATTRYWRGGTGTWDATTTTNWSASSGGAGGASVPTSADAVVFDSLSNATAYTVTCTATQLRCASLTIAGPLTGNVTWAGTAPLAIHGNVSLSATGITRTYTGAITLSGSTTGKTLTTNGVALSSDITVNGVGCVWTLGSAASFGATASLLVTNGSFNTGNFSLTVLQISSSNLNDRTIDFGSSTVTLTSAGTAIIFTNSINLTFNAGTSSLVLSGGGPSISGGSGVTFNNVSFTSVAGTSQAILGVNTFNNLSFTGRTSAGITFVDLSANQTINGTLTLSAGTNATMRTFVRSDTIGTTRTLTCASVSATDIDFRDITIAGAAAPVSGTRLGDCKGNSGITFPAAKTVYPTGSFGSANWGSGIWSTTQGGAQTTTDFPLAQDTVVVTSTAPNAGGTISLNANYNIGTIDMSARTSNTMTLATSTNTPAIYGNWINGTGTTLTGTGQMTFAGRGSQTITSAGKTFTQRFIINTPAGAVTLQDAATFSNSTSNVIDLLAGTFDAAVYNVTQTSTAATTLIGSSVTTAARTLAFGSGTWTFAATQTPCSISAANQTVSGTATLSFTSSLANKTFAGGGLNYSGITVNQGGSTQLIITGNNTFKDITNTYSATGASTISLGTTTQTVTQFTGTGTSGKVLTIQGTSASSPGTLILTSGTVTTPDYLAITGVRAYSLATTWYAGANSTNNGSLGWIFAAGGGTTYTGTILETSTATDLISASLFYGGVISETASATDALTAQADFAPSISETATGTDALLGTLVIPTAISELVTGTDIILGGLYITSAFADSATATDTFLPGLAFVGLISEASTATDTIAAQADFAPSISETATGTDAFTNTMVLTPAVYETATATDALTLTATFNTAALETASATDALTTAIAISVSLADSASAADTVLGLNTLSTTIAESGTATDALTTRLTATASLTETATATDLISPIFTFNVAAFETAIGTDEFTAIGTYNVSLADQAVATDIFAGAYLWNPIDDSQTPDWGPVNNAQAVTWSPVDDTQTPNWQNVNNSQTTAWVEVDDSQNPGWGTIQQNP